VTKARVRRITSSAALILLLVVCFSLAPALCGQALSVSAYETATDFQYPLKPGGWFLGQDFKNWRTARDAYHLGEDYMPSDYKTELPVYAPANGEVKGSGYISGYGYTVIIEHRLSSGSYVCSVLGHLKPNVVTRGTSVKKGQLVGYISNDPRENGGYNFAHLHFGIRSGVYSTARDADGGYRYRGYTPYQSIANLWYDPTDFIKVVNGSQGGSSGSKNENAKIVLSTLELNFKYVKRNTPTVKALTFKGTNLNGYVTVEAPAGYYISTKLNDPGAYKKTLTFKPSNGTVKETIYVAFKPTQRDYYISNLKISSPGAATRYIKVKGAGV
jgi:murein DD-endopeptidase MepM/ murein hydrolase activator NlpD